MLLLRITVNELSTRSHIHDRRFLFVGSHTHDFVCRVPQLDKDSAQEMGEAQISAMRAAGSTGREIVQALVSAHVEWSAGRKAHR